MQSFVVLPILGTTMVMSPMLSLGAKIQEATNLQAIKQVEISSEEALRLERAAKIDAFFAERGMPLAGYGYKMVLAAEANDLDWALLPAIAARESSGGIHKCKNPSAPNNVWGWHSCRSGFESMDKSIEAMGEHLGGNNPKTERHYKNKDTVGILNTYNPPSIVKNYTKQVLAIMSAIEKEEVTPSPSIATTETHATES